MFGQDLRILPKKQLNPSSGVTSDFTKLAQLMPCDLYSYNSSSPMICFNIEDVSRPACFVSVKPIFEQRVRSQTRQSIPVPHASVPQFWGFSLKFCDRSIWGGVHIDEHMSNAAVDTGLQPYILNDYNGIPADGGEDSGDDDAQEDDDPYLDELLND